MKISLIAPTNCNWTSIITIQNQNHKHILPNAVTLNQQLLLETHLPTPTQTIQHKYVSLSYDSKPTLALYLTKRLTAMASETAFRQSLKKELTDLYKDSFDLKEGLFRVHRDLSIIYKDKNFKPLKPAYTVTFRSKLNKLKVAYNAFVKKLSELELKCSGLKAEAYWNLDDELLPSKFVQACREQRSKAVKCEKYLKEVEDLIDAVMRPKN